MRRKRYLCGYMTVEASLVMVTVMVVYLFLIRTMLFQYDRTVWEQEVACMAIRYGDADANTLDEVSQYTKLNWDNEQYLLLLPQAPEWEIKGGYVNIRSEDNTIIPQEIQYKLWKIEPEVLLRIRRKVEMNQEKEEESE